MATYGQIQATVLNNIRRSDSAADLAGFVAAAVNEAVRYFKENHTWFNEEVVSITLNQGDPLVPNIPDDFLYEIERDGLVIAYSNTFWPLTKKHPVEYDLLNLQGSGRPEIYTYKAGQLLVYYYPDQAYTLLLYYVKNYDDLVSSDDTNDWTNNAADLLTCRVMAQAYRYIVKDIERANELDAEVVKLLDQIQRRTKRRVATGTLLTENIVETRAYPFGLFSRNRW